MPLQREHIQFALIVLRSGMISRYQYVPFLSKLGFFFFQICLSSVPVQLFLVEYFGSNEASRTFAISRIVNQIGLVNLLID
jgi:hypothetical protein